MNWIGIDYGSNLAGTTAICYVENNKLCITSSQKKKSADDFINRFIREVRVGAVYIDAPLSLPSAYFGTGSDFFYRGCDKELGAMSPMFLGGLTARAIRLNHSFPDLPFYESYPAQLIKRLNLKEYYTKKVSGTYDVLLQMLEKELPHPIGNHLSDWHQVDSLLCWLTGWRHQNNQHLVFGDTSEGNIVI
jgi:predicted nuclease with RNAse H fold